MMMGLGSVTESLSWMEPPAGALSLRTRRERPANVSANAVALSKSASANIATVRPPRVLVVTRAFLFTYASSALRALQLELLDPRRGQGLAVGVAGDHFPEQRLVGHDLRAHRLRQRDGGLAGFGAPQNLVVDLHHPHRVGGRRGPGLPAQISWGRLEACR